MILKKISYKIPANYSTHPCVVLDEKQEEVLFEGYLHRVEDIDGIEGMHDEPVRLERDGEYFEIPTEWIGRFAKYPTPPLEPSHV